MLAHSSAPPCFALQAADIAYAAAVTIAAAATAPSAITAEPAAAHAKVQPLNRAYMAPASPVRTGVLAMPPAAETPTIENPAAV